MIREIESEFPRFRLVDKRKSPLSRAIDVALRLCTLGRQKHYMTHYHTVIGNTLYVPDSWQSTPDIDKVIVLRHERVHLRQRRRYGMVLMALIYLLPIVPLGLAYGRARLEWEAYEETLRATAELLGPDHARSAALKRRIIGRFTGPDYGWMWPFPRAVERWYDRALSRIESEAGRGPRWQS